MKNCTKLLSCYHIFLLSIFDGFWTEESETFIVKFESLEVFVQNGANNSGSAFHTEVPDCLTNTHKEALTMQLKQVHALNPIQPKAVTAH